MINITKYKLNNEAFKIWLYFAFLQIFYGLTMGRKIQKLHSTKSVKKDKKDNR